MARIFIFLLFLVVTSSAIAFADSPLEASFCLNRVRHDIRNIRDILKVSFIGRCRHHAMPDYGSINGYG